MSVHLDSSAANKERRCVQDAVNYDCVILCCQNIGEFLGLGPAYDARQLFG